MTPGSPKPTALPADTVAVLVDAYGTLVGLEPPVPLLREAMARAGHRHEPAAVAGAFAAEVAHYRAQHLRAGTPAGLAAVRLECAEVMVAHLGGDAPPPPAMAALLLASMRFRLFPDALPALAALRARGLRLALVSNWDMTLADVLTRLGIAGYFEVVTISAVCGVAKPDPAIYTLTLAHMGLAPGRVVHVGDDERLDGEGAAAAGVRAVLVDRARGESGAAATGVPQRFMRIAHLTDLVDPTRSGDEISSSHR